jgi:NADH-quinone oxidoreductase subunit J
MGLTQTLFAGFGLLALATALAAVLTRHTVYAALWFISHLLCLAALYALLNAPLLALLQVIVYAGAVMVLFLFAIMTLDASVLQPAHPLKEKAQALGAFALGLAVFSAALGFGLRHLAGRALNMPLSPVPPAPEGGNIPALARLLYRDYLFPFELVSVILLIAMLGILVMASRGPRVRN